MRRAWGWCPRNMLLPCVTTPNFVAVCQTIWAYVGSKIFWGCWGPDPLGRGCGWPPGTRYSPGLTVPNLVALGQTVWAYIGTQKPGEAGAPPIEMGDVDDPLQTCFSPPVLPCQIWSYLVKPYERNYGDTPEKFDPSHPAVKITQGHWNRHRSIGHLLLVIYGPISCHFRDKKAIFAKFSHI